MSRNSFCQRSWEHWLQGNKFANKLFFFVKFPFLSAISSQLCFSHESCLFMLNFTYSSSLAQSLEALWQATLFPTVNYWVPRQRIKLEWANSPPPNTHNPLTPPFFVLNNRFPNLRFSLSSGKKSESNKGRTKISDVLRK